LIPKLLKCTSIISIHIFSSPCYVTYNHLYPLLLKWSQLRVLSLTYRANESMIHIYNSNLNITLSRFVTITLFIYPLQNLPSVDPTAQDYTESSPTMSSATLSGTVGEARLADTNVLRVWLTTANPGYACGPTKYQNAKSKVSISTVYDIVFGQAGTYTQ